MYLRVYLIDFVMDFDLIFFEGLMKKFNKRKRLSWLILIIVFLITTVKPGFSETEKERDIIRLLEVSGIRKQLTYMQDTLMNSMSMMISGPFPKIPDGFWREFNQLIGKKEMDDLVQKIIPVYDKHMSHETVKKLIDMFETPFWEEWKEMMPQISREAGLIGSEWGKELSESPAFNKKIDELVKKYELEKINKQK